LWLAVYCPPEITFIPADSNSVVAHSDYIKALLGELATNADVQRSSRLLNYNIAILDSNVASTFVVLLASTRSANMDEIWIK